MTERSNVGKPAIILVEPQLGENIGTAARAMANFGLDALRIVNPRDGWPSEKARAAASRADHVIDAVKVYETAQEAVADLSFVYATTARPRGMSKPVLGPAEAAAHAALLGRQATPTGILFGRERWGLTNDEVALADEIVTLPVDPTFASLNIAQAVLILSYEWRKASIGDELPFSTTENAPPASKDDVLRLMAHLEGALDDVHYFRPPEKKPVMTRNLLNILQKARLSEQETRTLRGVVAALEHGPLTDREVAERRRARKAAQEAESDEGSLIDDGEVETER